MEEAEILELARLLGKLKEEQEQEEVDDSVGEFYLPNKVPKNFYYDAVGLRNLTKVNSEVFRKLVIPDLRRLRR